MSDKPLKELAAMLKIEIGDEIDAFLNDLENLGSINIPVGSSSRFIHNL